MPNLSSMLLTLPIVLLSLTVHEFAHAATANVLGDPTPRWEGRLTLNPLAHLDVFGTLPLIITRRFGWAKPVPINPAYFKDWRQGMALVGVAGPLSNVALAFIFALPYRLGIRMPYYLDLISYFAILINLGLASYNLIPIPPLDGSRILIVFLRGKNLYIYQQLEQYGQFILLLLIFTGTTSVIMLPIMRFLAFVITGLRMF